MASETRGSDKCMVHQFSCHKSGLCISKHQVCDGTFDCGSGDDSDEAECPGCPTDKFTCGSTFQRPGVCKPRYVRCDGHDDCGDGSDEHGCGEPY
ncbi:unnamed protein product [Protopolystoma xenopodis]|uniref:Uncharacterized protein n=1 Tax=Protopolystoma xenopodis TaxID=117903 RepID=A0A448WHG9_9PLAT|nr:unnamed protein product [Protopolystoma xenopodis]